MSDNLLRCCLAIFLKELITTLPYRLSVSPRIEIINGKTLALVTKETAPATFLTYRHQLSNSFLKIPFPSAYPVATLIDPTAYLLVLLHLPFLHSQAE